MSFCTEVKNELLNLRLSRCCPPAFTYGFMLFARSFSIKRICLQTANEEVAKGYCKAVFDAYGVSPQITKGGSLRPTFVAEVKSESDRLKILASHDFGINENAIDRSLFYRDCCSAAFIRGAFLACGNINDPEKEYRLEFNVKTENLAAELKTLLFEYGIEMKSVKRGKGAQLYTKESSAVEDLLTLMGAVNLSLDIMDKKVMKSVKNHMNRANNCDSANISKTVEASIKQRTAIEYIEKTAGFSSLPPELIFAANLRKNNPDATLKELCALSDEKITVSGLNHRFSKIIEIYDRRKNGK